MNNFIYDLNGDVLVFGYNSSGQLGLGHNKNINIPTLLMNDKILIIKILFVDIIIQLSIS